MCATNDSASTTAVFDYNDLYTDMRERNRRNKRRRALLVCEMALACTLALVVMLHLSSSIEKATAKEREVTCSPVAAEQVGETAANEASSSRNEQDDSDWMLILVNEEHPFKGQVPELVKTFGARVDARCAESLQRMFDDARGAGVRPAINSAYRSREDQQAILDGAVAEQVSEGMSGDEARKNALQYVALPGASEHETGLAVDLTSEYRDGDEQDMAVHAWMADHSWEYGWILRYPADKEKVTGINNEPWHYRYVGEDAAREIHERGICLEEYLKD